MFQEFEEYIQLKSALHRVVEMSTPWKPNQLWNRGEKMEPCNVTQAIHVDCQKFESITDGNITAIIFDGIRHFKATHALIYTDDKHIDIDIKQVRHTIGFDLTKDELIKAGIGHYLTNEPVTFVEWERR